MIVLKEFGKRLASGLARKLGIEGAPATPVSRPKVVQARVLTSPDEDSQSHGAPLAPKGVVRVIAGADDDFWIKKL